MQECAGWRVPRRLYRAGYIPLCGLPRCPDGIYPSRYHLRVDQHRPRERGPGYTPPSGKERYPTVGQGEVSHRRAEVHPTVGQRYTPPSGNSKNIPPSGNSKDIPPSGRRRLHPTVGQEEATPHRRATGVHTTVGQQEYIHRRAHEDL